MAKKSIKKQIAKAKRKLLKKSLKQLNEILTPTELKNISDIILNVEKAQPEHSTQNTAVILLNKIMKKYDMDDKIIDTKVITKK